MDLGRVKGGWGLVDNSWFEVEVKDGEADIVLVIKYL